ncbi:tetratricopeptide repeat-containing sensor histidine kinase [Flavobacterium gawalongense]|uniref:histidine kinase n=1 Tax=Flavobacterium gawalongense TaxID=2594432 RepID=A0A553BFJ9_9FLAO|nr:tetratricopeptide repeat-containing sensor histidine kinase [Flavobacterium gawalongense]TRX07027.1 two-component sensor histidine kinase [Flavobacterium gawalongense]TRX10311.1 two-component sensor histidine kinase [Flavobacterium gawalongense]TRX27681.1 two-component sensor histidine kinase [Flavobacterium gawalongense]
MSQFRINIVSILLLLFFSTVFFAQEKTPSKKEITQLAKEANQYMKKGHFEKSLVKARIALHYAIAIKDDNLIASIYNTIGANFDELTEFDKAFFYYNKGLIYANKTNNNQLKNWLYNNLGNIYCFDKKQYEKGIVCYKKSLEYSNKTSDFSQTVFTKLNIAWAYFDIGDFDKGIPYLNYINQYHKKYGDASTLVALNMLNGMYHGYKNDIEKANFFFQNAIRLGNEGDEKSDLSFSHQEYSKFLLKNGKFQKAYENLALYNSITAELNYEEKLKKANVAGINLEIDGYKREIDNIETKYKTKQYLLLEKQSKNKKISIVVISLLLLIIILFYFLFQNTKLKQNNKLKDLQSKIQENIINASINGQELERKKIASFLHDNISALLSSAGLHLNVFTSQNQSPPQEILKTKAILVEAHDKVRDLSHELMPTLLARFGLFYALEALCEKNSNSVIQFKYSSPVPTKKRYNEEFEMKIYFIISELLNNITKHSQANTAKITIQENNSTLQIHVYDNGKGFDPAHFHILEGFGLNQIQARINNLKGGISIDSKQKSGTSIYIVVPIAHK